MVAKSYLNVAATPISQSVLHYIQVYIFYKQGHLITMENKDQQVTTSNPNKTSKCV